MEGLPPRYEALHRLGQGGGGEVWAVRDRVLGTSCALKVLSKDAGELELAALVREAVALSGLEGLGVPRVLAFGALDEETKTPRRYMVRELVVGKSLEELFARKERAWLEPLVSAADQLTALHRAGLLHGDVKPANVIVGSDGRGTLVDLGLAAPWREGGTQARGLTPKYAAPELLAGGPLTVRAEVYALGATLAEGLSRAGAGLPESSRVTLAQVAARGKDDDPQKRYPSTGEIASAMRLAAGLPSVEESAPAWPVIGMDAAAQKLAVLVGALGDGEAVAIVGESGAGRSTLLRRVAWSLGIEGRRVVLADVPQTGMSPREALALELEDPRTTPSLPLLAVDDADTLPEDARELVRRSTKAGARLVIVGSEKTASSYTSGRVIAFPVPPLDTTATTDLLKRAMPSLPPALVARIQAHTGGKPGALRAVVRALAGRAIVSEHDIDEALEAEPSKAESPEEAVATAERLIDTGRVAHARARVDRIGRSALSPDLRLRVVIVDARVRTASGEPALAVEVLESVDPSRRTSSAWCIAMSRALLRIGRYAEAIEVARLAKDKDEVVEALAALGVAQAYVGDDAGGRASLERAVAMAHQIGDARREGIALGSLGLVHQRAGRMADAKGAYANALKLSESARDATTVAAARLNLAALAREDGDIASAIEHLEATVDLGKRAGGLLAVQQARINLVNLDLYLGRHARARAAIDALEREVLPNAARAQLLGCRAELAGRTDDMAGAARLYEACAVLYDEQGRASDAAEARLEGLFMRASTAPDPEALLAEVDAQSAAARGSHEELVLLVRGVLEARCGHDDRARAILDEAVVRAKAAGQQERTVWALSARARLLGPQGLRIQAHRDVEAALSMLEDTASKLPRDSA